MSQKEDALEQRKSDATSDETVDDVEKTEDGAETTDSNGDPGPSPDGELDSNDELKDTGPM
ncbi:MAG TPA: hypothetical protein VJV03_20165 [Pyrinomonadaceae bacterium]|nr:hypothetical protein [Pyrinomonadaceae bacterium]